MKQETEVADLPNWLLVLITMVVVGLIAWGFAYFLGMTSAQASSPRSNSPKNANEVHLVNGVEKWCDGPNLVYQAGAGANGVSLQVLKDDPQCR